MLAARPAANGRPLQEHNDHLSFLSSKMIDITMNIIIQIAVSSLIILISLLIVPKCIVNKKDVVITLIYLSTLNVVSSCLLKRCVFSLSGL